MAARGRLVFVAGQIGWTRDQQFLATDLAGQVRQALSNIVAVLAEAGAGPEHVTRLTWYLVDRRDYLARVEDIGRVYREVMGRHFPAMSVVEVSALLEEAAVVEIEATAVIPEAGP
jgi:enamine deaminase RidA (YjgF/YER057c/UK114 family)